MAAMHAVTVMTLLLFLCYRSIWRVLFLRRHELQVIWERYRPDYLATKHEECKYPVVVSSEHADPCDATLSYLTATREVWNANCSVHVPCAQGNKRLQMIGYHHCQYDIWRLVLWVNSFTKNCMMTCAADYKFEILRQFQVNMPAAAD